MLFATSSTRVALALVVVAAFAGITPALAACACANGGTVDTSSASCACICPSPYQLPTCSWTATATVQMILVVQPTSGTIFSSRVLAYAIADHYNVDRTLVTSVRRMIIEEPASGSEYHLLMNIVGTVVGPLLTDLAPVASWLQQQHVTGGRVWVQAQSPASNLAVSPFLFNITAGPLPITFQWASIEWGVGGLIMFICLPLVEVIASALCFSVDGHPDDDLVNHDDFAGAGPH